MIEIGINLSLIVAAFAIIAALTFRLLREIRINRLQSEFLSTISHELKTPVAAMGLTSSLIRSGNLSDEELSALWESHDAELKRLRQEVDTLLEAARCQGQWFRIKPLPILLEHWIEESLPRWRTLLGTNAELIREGESLDCQARVDLRSLNLIADNLFDNARKYSKGTPRIILRTKRHQKSAAQSVWTIEVEDEGWGFSHSDSKKLFERFFRGRTHAPYAIPGTGLGLYIAQSMCRAMGIKLHGHTLGVGVGAVFTLEGKVSKSL